MTFQELLDRWMWPVIFIAGLFIFLFITKKLYKKYKKQKFGNDAAANERATWVRIGYSVVKFAVWVMIVLIAMDACGINIKGAVAGLGLASAIGALAVQDLLKDLIMGANIISDKYFAIDDVVEFDGKVGTVIHLTMRSTKIRQADGSIITVGNHYIEKITKLSTENLLLVPLPYELQAQKARDFMNAVVKKIKTIPEVSDAKYSGIQEFAESSVNHTILFYCDPKIKYSTRRSVNSMIYDELEKADISIPYNQIVIHNGDL